MRTAILYGRLVGDAPDSAGRLGLVRVDYEHGGFIKNNQEKQKDSTIQNVSMIPQMIPQMMLGSAFFHATRSVIVSYCRLFLYTCLDGYQNNSAWWRSAKNSNDITLSEMKITKHGKSMYVVKPCGCSDVVVLTVECSRRYR